MFAYNPGVYDEGGQILSRAATNAAATNAAGIENFGRIIGDKIKEAGQAAAGFAMGGPAGAAMAMQGGGGGGGGGGADDSVIGSFVSAYANNKALEAKGQAYGDFMKRHGDQLGFDPEWIKGFLSESPRQQAMIGDSIIGMQNTGRQLMNMNYLNAQMGPRTAGPATGTGAGAAAPRESFTF
jgi:hypothetical protein